MNLREFIQDLLRLAHDALDIDGGAFQDAAVKHGLLEERSLTAEEIADEDGPWHEHGYNAGDPWLFHTAELKAFLREPAE